MKVKNRSIVVAGTVTAGCLLLLPLAGCEDTDARERAEVQQALSEASAQYRRATVTGVSLRDETVEQARHDLNAVVGSLDGITRGGPSQRAAAAVRSADALAELTAMNLEEAKLIQRSLARKRHILHGQLDGMKLLSARAKGRSQATADEFLASTRQLKQSLEQDLHNLQLSIQDIESPIAELERLNEDDREKVQELRQQTNELLRRAAELGHADGFDDVKEAAAARRGADRLEHRAAMRTIELDYEKRPQYQLLRHRMRGAQAQIEALDATLNDLAAFEEMRTGDVSRLQQRVAERRSTVQQAVREIVDRQSDELDPLYEEAEGFLQRAVNSAGRAAGQLRGDNAAFAHLVEMRSYEMLGELYWSRARGVSDHAKLLAALVEAGELVGRTEAYATELEAAHTLIEQLMESASESYQQAINSADRITGPAADSIRPARDRLEEFSAAIVGGQVYSPGVDRD